MVDGLINVENVMVRIISAEGKSMPYRAIANSRFEGYISMVGFEPGQYFVQVLANNQVYYTAKIVKK